MLNRDHIDGLLAAESFISRSDDADLETDRWLRAHGVDTARAWTVAGPIIEHDVNVLERRLFDFARSGDPYARRAVVHIAHADNAESPVDLIAWTREHPGRVFRRLGTADAIGGDQVRNPASYFGGQALPVHRTPLDWLIAGCRGIVIVNPSAVRTRLAALPNRPGGYALAVPDLPFGRTLRRVLSPLPAGVRLVLSIPEAA